jgi:DNA-binding transcriptional MerR regulator
MQSRELVKLYYRIGEVSDIVGVQPHVLRYWETEFRSIRPQKSSKGQRVYSRRDVEKLLRVKDLLKNQGFTIAGARKRLSEPAPEPAPEPVEAESGAKNMRRVLLGLRQDLMRMIEQISEPRTAPKAAPETVEWVGRGGPLPPRG